MKAYPIMSQISRYSIFTKSCFFLVFSPQMSLFSYHLYRFIYSLLTCTIIGNVAALMKIGFNAQSDGSLGKFNTLTPISNISISNHIDRILNFLRSTFNGERIFLRENQTQFYFFAFKYPSFKFLLFSVLSNFWVAFSLNVSIKFVFIKTVCVSIHGCLRNVAFPTKQQLIPVNLSKQNFCEVCYLQLKTCYSMFLIIPFVKDRFHVSTLLSRGNPTKLLIYY